MSNANGKKGRCLSPQFMKDLKGGFLSPLKEKVKNDYSLSLEIRDNYINIYYRGGNLLKLSEVKAHCYEPSFEENYAREKDTFLNGLPKEVLSPDHLKAWLDKFPLLKSIMDSWFSKHPKLEREFQQMVVWENNNSSIAKSTDYFIADIEYDNNQGSRFDMVAIQWDSTASARKLQSENIPKLCFIEMKYGDAALGGKAGMLDHVEQWSEYLSQEKNKKYIKKEMLNLFQQKRDLCLMAGLKDNPNEVKSFSDEIDCIFLLANHDPEKSGLKEVIYKLGQIEIPCVEIKFCASNFMGYGLYKENVINIDKFQKRYNTQIYSKG